MRLPGLGSFFSALVRRELTLALRRRVDIANPLFFFLMVVAMFPMGVGPDPTRLASFAPGVIWIVALLSTLLAADALFRSDYEDGCLEQLLLSPQPLFVAVLARLLAHWLVSGIPLTRHRGSTDSWSEPRRGFDITYHLAAICSRIDLW
jgi:heme exporter protein B